MNDPHGRKVSTICGMTSLWMATVAGVAMFLGDVIWSAIFAYISGMFTTYTLWMVMYET